MRSAPQSATKPSRRKAPSNCSDLVQFTAYSRRALANCTRDRTASLEYAERKFAPVRQSSGCCAPDVIRCRTQACSISSHLLASADADAQHACAADNAERARQLLVAAA